MCKVYSLILSEKSHEIVEVMIQEEKRREEKLAEIKVNAKIFSVHFHVCSTHGTKEVECITKFSPHTSAALQLLLL